MKRQLYKKDQVRVDTQGAAWKQGRGRDTWRYVAQCVFLVRRRGGQGKEQFIFHKGRTRGGGGKREEQLVCRTKNTRATGGPWNSVSMGGEQIDSSTTRRSSWQWLDSASRGLGEVG